MHKLPVTQVDYGVIIFPAGVNIAEQKARLAEQAPGVKRWVEMPVTPDAYVAPLAARRNLGAISKRMGSSDCNVYVHSDCGDIAEGLGKVCVRLQSEAPKVLPKLPALRPSRH